MACNIWSDFFRFTGTILGPEIVVRQAHAAGIYLRGRTHNCFIFILYLL